MSADEVDLKKRRFLTLATTAVGGVGAAFVAVPFIASMNPSAKAKAAGAPVEADISKLEDGQMIRVKWRGKPVWIVKRTEQNLKDLPGLNGDLADPASDTPQQPEYCKNENRSIKPEILVAVGICTHLGCSPTYIPELAAAAMGQDWKGGFFCPCHGSRFDLAGRVFSGFPAPTNLEIPPHHYATDTKIVVGLDGGAA